MERIALRPGYEISRVIRGGWQLAGGHGAVDRAAAVADLAAFCEAGIVTFDCADIYTGVEELIGEFRMLYAQQHGRAALAGVRVHTKLVPDLEILPRIRRSDVRAIIDRSLMRLKMERLDLVQFHWWDYEVPGMVETALWLDEVRREGKVELIGGTNFDTASTRALLEAGMPLATMQVQYSLLDARPEHGLIDLCHTHDIHLLPYGSVAGGFLADRWLGALEPRPPFENRSLTKYKLIIDDFGGWALFQELLGVLQRIGRSREVGLAAVASRYILEKPEVAAVIIGARSRRHLAENVALGRLRLSPHDIADIDAVLALSGGPEGEVFALERDRTGRHGSIMRYDLNKLPA